MVGIRLFLIGIVASALIGAGFYVMKLRSDNEILKANAIKLEDAITDQKQLIENQQKDFEQILNANKEMTILIDTLKKDLTDLDKRFNKKNRVLVNLQLKEQNQFRELRTALVIEQLVVLKLLVVRH